MRSPRVAFYADAAATRTRSSAQRQRSRVGEGRGEDRRRPSTAEKPRFDFYKILPGVEEPKVQPERKAQERTDRASPAKRRTSRRRRPPRRRQCRRRRHGRRRKSPRPSRQGGASQRAVLAAGGIVRERGRRGEPEGAARAGGLGSHHSAGHAAGQGGRAFACGSAPTTIPTSSTGSRASSAERGFDAAVIKY